jgi:hypothetical protein
VHRNKITEISAWAKLISQALNIFLQIGSHIDPVITGLQIEYAQRLVLYGLQTLKRQQAAANFFFFWQIPQK